MNDSNTTKSKINQDDSILNLESLSDDLLVKILSFLDVISLYKARFINKRFFKLVNSHTIWNPVIHDFFGLHPKIIRKIDNPFNWFIHQVCINSHLTKLEKMPDNVKLEFQFELTLLNHRIPYNSCVPLRLLHGPLQNNISIFLLILQTILIYLKLDEFIDNSWAVLLTPVWLFNILLFLCSWIWFYFLSKGIISEEYADECLFGFIKNILNILQMGCKWFNYTLYILISTLCLYIFPILFVLKMDNLYGHLTYFFSNKIIPMELSWMMVLSPLIIGCIATIGMVHLGINSSYKKQKYHWLGTLKFIMIELYLFAAFLIILGLQLDDYMPSFWNFKYSFIPLFIMCLVSLLLIANAFEHDSNGRRNRVIRRSTGSYMTTVPIILLITVFLTFLVLRIENIKTDGMVKGNYLFSFCYLFAVESLIILYWLQDIIDFGGYRQYDTRKKFEFTLESAMYKMKKKQSI